MLFNSWQFLLFFPLVTAFYFLLPHRLRWALLLVSSCFFYMSFVPKYILILLATIIVDYAAAIGMEKAKGWARSCYLATSVIVTCLILFFFKYFDFAADNVSALAKMLDWNYSLAPMHLLLPIGLSFHTFQSLSYIIEVYRGKQKAERNFGIYALYVMFYPQLVAGPIERPQNLLHQFREHHAFNYENVTQGLRLMAWGLFQKVVIADRLALFVNPVYDNPTHYHGWTLLIATFFFAFQIYCDFAGYTDIARGAARVMGFHLMLNFNFPYTAKTLGEFWQRWHISLSTWLRDYIYEPMALRWRYGGTVGIAAALIITFFVSGLWHGANWTYVVWGLLHGFMLSLEALVAKPRKKLAKKLPPLLYTTCSVLLTFTFVDFTYIFFRARTLSDAKYIVGHLFDGLFPFHQSWIAFLRGLAAIYGSRASFFVSVRDEFNFSVLLVLALIALPKVRELTRYGGNASALPWWVRWPAYQLLMFALAGFGIWFAEKRSFIYFQF